MRRGPAAALVVLAALPLAGSMAACSSGRPQVELSQAAPSAGTTPPTVPTVTLTETMTRTVVATTTVVTTATVTATPTVTVTMLPHPSLTTTSVFNPTTAKVDYANLVADVGVLDRMPLTGNAAALQLDVLATHLAALSANGAPPSLDPPSYYGRLNSLRLFASAASDEAAASSPQAAARYTIIRQETGLFLALVNGALKTAFILPTAPSSPPPTTG